MKIKLTVDHDGVVYELIAKDMGSMLSKMKPVLGMGVGTINFTALQYVADKIMMVTKNKRGKTVNDSHYTTSYIKHVLLEKAAKDNDTTDKITTL